LHTTAQTLPHQLEDLEGWLDTKLFRKSVRRIQLTDGDRLGLGLAPRREPSDSADGSWMFALSDKPGTAVPKVPGGNRVLDFRFGVAYFVVTSVAYRLFESALSVAAPLRIISSE